jgi:hypothetical protein
MYIMLHCFFKCTIKLCMNVVNRLYEYLYFSIMSNVSLIFGNGSFFLFIYISAACIYEPKDLIKRGIQRLNYKVR